MKYKYSPRKKVRKLNLQEVMCAHCKSPLLKYYKGGKGGLIKLQVPRVLESEVDLKQALEAGEYICPKCQASIAKAGEYQGRPTFWITRGQVNTRWL